MNKKGKKRLVPSFRKKCGFFSLRLKKNAASGGYEKGKTKKSSSVLRKKNSLNAIRSVIAKEKASPTMGRGGLSSRGKRAEMEGAVRESSEACRGLASSSEKGGTPDSFNRPREGKKDLEKKKKKGVEPIRKEFFPLKGGSGHPSGGEKKTLGVLGVGGVGREVSWKAIITKRPTKRIFWQKGGRNSTPGIQRSKGTSTGGKGPSVR